MYIVINLSCNKNYFQLNPKKGLSYETVNETSIKQQRGMNG